MPQGSSRHGDTNDGSNLAREKEMLRRARIAPGTTAKEVTATRRGTAQDVRCERRCAGENDVLPSSPIGNPRWASRGQRLIDAAVKAGLIAMIVLAPLANGAVSHDAYAALELGALGLVALWMVRIIISERHSQFVIPMSIVAPLLALVLLVGLQLVPLPGWLLGGISPRTFEVYSRTLRGWPDSTPYREVLAKVGIPASERSRSLASEIGNWRTVSLAPSVTSSALLKLLGYISTFLVVLLYPFAGPEARISERRFCRSMLIGVLASGFVSAFLALVIWSAQAASVDEATEQIRAGGMFVNPDHFACFVSMILPIALASTVFKGDVAPRGWSVPFRVFCGITAFVTLAGLLLSGSRSGWAGAALGMAGLLLLMRLHRRRASSNSALKTTQLVAAAVICLVLIAFIGTRGQQTVERRLRETASDSSLVDRVGVWKDSLPMLRDFPLLGVGLGCWSEIFSRYESPPWPADKYWGEPHNDYLQALCEIGLIGFIIAGWLFGRLFRPVLSAARNFDINSTPLAAGIIGSVVAVAVEECVDFGLQIPANILILTVLLALGLRTVEQPRRVWTEWRPASPLVAAVVATVVIILGVVAVVRPLDAATSYDPKTPLQARSFLLAHPAQVDAHMSLLEQFGESMTNESFRAEVETELWLDPANPYARDLHALVLLDRRERQHALAEIRQSMLFSPTLSTHAFLFADNSHLAALPGDEREAIRAGLAQAAARAYHDSVQSLSEFYEAVGQPARAADIYDAAAVAESDAIQKSTLLIQAGDSAIGANDLERAQVEFEKAISATPLRAAPYEQLVDLMFRKQDAASAQKVADRAVRNNVDPSIFYVSLAEGERDLGDLRSAQANALKAFNDHPSDPEVVQVLGTIYLAQRRNAEAAALFRRLCELAPTSAQAFFDLGAAEESDYQWFAAEKAFQRALALDPKNVDYKVHYDQFETRLARSKTGGVEP